MTSSAVSTHRLVADDPRALAVFSGLLASAGFSESGIADALKIQRQETIARAESALLLRRLPERGALSALIKLFVIGLPVEPAVVERDCAPVSPSLLEDLGLVTPGPAGLVPRVRLHPFAGFYLASDPLFDDYGEIAPDYVTGMNPTSASVAAITPRNPVGSTLDLGTGFGVQALLASRHSGRVVGTDVNARALNVAAFNAALNQVGNVEFREGSLFDPVKGEKFDLIACNPPYVISPESGLIFRDSGTVGDGLSRQIVREAPAHLNEGGFAAIRCNWTLRSGETGTGPVASWVMNSECDALLLFSHAEYALDYAANWNRLFLPRRQAEFEARLARWLEYFKTLGVEAVGTGCVILRKRSGTGHWIRTDHLTGMGDPEGGRLILRMFAAQDWIATSADPLKGVFGPSPDIRIEQVASFEGGRFGIREVAFSFIGGLQLRVAIDPTTLGVLSSLDGSRTLGETLERLIPAAAPESAKIRTKITQNVVQLYSLGFLLRKTVEG
jgi:methylase of polypeptide subunit release factors